MASLPTSRWVRQCIVARKINLYVLNACRKTRNLVWLVDVGLFPTRACFLRVRADPVGKLQADLFVALSLASAQMRRVQHAVVKVALIQIALIVHFFVVDQGGLRYLSEVLELHWIVVVIHIVVYSRRFLVLIVGSVVASFECAAAVFQHVGRVLTLGCETSHRAGALCRVAVPSVLRLSCVQQGACVDWRAVCCVFVFHLLRRIEQCSLIVGLEETPKLVLLVSDFILFLLQVKFVT